MYKTGFCKGSFFVHFSPAITRIIKKSKGKEKRNRYAQDSARKGIRRQSVSFQESRFGALPARHLLPTPMSSIRGSKGKDTEN